MKKNLLSILLLLFLLKPELKAQYAPLDVHYRAHYQIFDNEKGYTLDRNLNNSNVYGNPTDHGANHQRWMIMPTYVGSTEYYIASKSNGSILDINGNGNVYAYDGYAHGGNNQIMKLNKVTNDFIPKYTIGSALNSQKVFDRSNSSQTRDPFNYPGSSRNNIYFGNYHGGPNQLFVLNAGGGSTPELWEYRTRNNNAIAQPPSPTNLQGAGLCNECNETFKAEAIIPFTMVENDMSRTQQVQSSPYYRVESKQYWRLVGSKIFPANTTETMKVTETVGTSSTQVDEIVKTLKVSFSANKEISFTVDKLISGKIAQALGISYDRTTRSTTTHTQNYSKTVEVFNSFTATSQTLIAEYQLVDRYLLYRMDGTKIKEWDVALDPKFNTRVSYVCGTRCRVPYAGKIVVKSQGYTSKNTYQNNLGYSKEEAHNSDFAINSVYPNPFQSSVKVDLSIPESANVQVELYDLLGKKVKYINKVISVAGNTILEVDGSNLPDGFYIIKVEATAINDRKKKFSYQKKLVLHK